MVENPRNNEIPVASSSTAAAAAPSTPDNPVVVVAQKAKSAVKQYVARPGMEHRPSVRLLHQPYSSSIPHTNRPVQRGYDALPEQTSSGGIVAGLLSIFRKRNVASNVSEKDHLPTVIEEPGESGRKRIMVPRRVAEELAPHIAAHTDGNEDPEAVAKHFAAHADSYIGTEKEDPSAIRRATERAGDGIRSFFGREKYSGDNNLSSNIYADDSDEYSSDMVDLLDVVGKYISSFGVARRGLISTDPQVSTLSTLTNVQNSLFIPSLGRVLDRRPAYRLSAEPEALRRLHKLKASLKDASTTMKERAKTEISAFLGRPRLARVSSISSTLTDAHYAVLQHGETLDGWTPEEKEMLDDLVRHSLHSRRAKFKRALKGFGQYVRRPLGLFVTVYATLITIFGAAWVLFLIGWISIGSKRDYVVNIVDNILVALFAVIGDGLAPFRAVDTYHMIFIAYYYRKTWKLRRKLGLPDLIDHNDLPERQIDDINPDADIESLAAQRTLSRRSTGSFVGEYSVLTEAEQARLEHHERKFSKSHTFYKPHETATHYAFPLRLLVTVVILLDFHSMLQISLGACTWGIPYKSRPFALTTVILCCSITCNIMGGVFISIGDHRTRKKDVLELMMRRELTSEAIEKIVKQRMKEAEEQGVIDKSTRKKAEDEMDDAENEEIKKAWKKVPLLPKTLLGKGVDSREPSLPQKYRKSSKRHPQTEGKGKEMADSKSTPTPAAKPTIAARLGLGMKSTTQTSGPSQVDRIDHAPAHPEPATTKNNDPQQGTKDKIMRMIRRADMDIS